ncbi:hypothetical protein MJD09_16190, partial [bacterium]|nr:hypothetical protein [bacterium]
EPHLGVGDAADDGVPRPTFLYDFPAHQAALARVRPASGSEPAVAERFEVFVRGVELANGFVELTDADEQLARFENDRERRRRMRKPEPSIDPDFMAALRHGLPPCAGVAVGFDRLMMLYEDVDDISEVSTFVD